MGIQVSIDTGMALAVLEDAASDVLDLGEFKSIEIVAYRSDGTKVRCALPASDGEARYTNG